MWHRNPLVERNRPWSLGRGPVAAPPWRREKAPSVTPARQTSELLRLQSGNELLKGKVKLLEDQVADRDAQLAGVRRERQWADELPKERDSQLLSECAAANKSESGWRTRKTKLLDGL